MHFIMWAVFQGSPYVCCLDWSRYYTLRSQVGRRSQLPYRPQEYTSYWEPAEKRSYPSPDAFSYNKKYFPSKEDVLRSQKRWGFPTAYSYYKRAEETFPSGYQQPITDEYYDEPQVVFPAGIPYPFYGYEDGDKRMKFLTPNQKRMKFLDNGKWPWWPRTSVHQTKKSFQLLEQTIDIIYWAWVPQSIYQKQ